MRHIAGDRLIGVTARLLVAAAVSVVVGLFLVLRNTWQQLGQSLGPDGTVTTVGVPFADRATMMVVESSHRSTGAQLVLASALVAAAVAALHRHHSWERVRRLRWEVLAAGLLVLAVVLGLVLVNVYVVTVPDGAVDEDAISAGPQPFVGMAVANLATLCASLLILTGATLWWLRLAPAPDDDREDPVEEQPAASEPAPGRESGDASRSAGDGSTADWSRDWSPEDFRPPG